MGINLEKGGRVNLSKEAPSMNKVRVGLSWNPNAFDTGHAFDLDVSVFVLKDNAGTPKLLSDDHLVFYNNPATPNKSVVHSGDNRTGDAAGDDETILVDLAKVEADASEVSFIVTIYEADNRKQNFGQIPKSAIRLYNDETGEEVAVYSLEDDFSTETAVQFGSLYRNNGAWMFKAVGAGYKKGLGDFVNAYR